MSTFIVLFLLGLAFWGYLRDDLAEVLGSHAGSAVHRIVRPCSRVHFSVHRDSRLVVAAFYVLTKLPGT